MNKNNVGSIEQMFSLFIGSGLLIYGMAQRRRERLLPLLVGGGLLFHGLSGHSRLYDALGIDDLDGGPTGHPLQRTVHFRESLVITRSPEELYAFWRDFKNLPRFMNSIVRVEEVDETHSRWYAHGPFNTQYYWEAEILEDRPNELIRWRTIESESNLEHEGTFSLRRSPGNRGTILTLDCRWSPPGGVVGAAASKLLSQDPARQVGEDLRRFRQLMETGEITRNDLTPPGQKKSGNRQTLREITDELRLTDPMMTEQNSHVPGP